MTGMQTELSYARFFAPKERSPQVVDVVHECVARKSSLHLKLSRAGVTLSVDSSDPQDRLLTLSGRWRSAVLEGEHRSAGALVLVPFVFLIEELCLPHTSLFTLGRGGRWVSDFFMRNFFYAACRQEKMLFHTVPAAPSDAITKGSHDLARTYLWIAKANLKAKVFDRGNAPELILADTHLPLMAYSNPLMDAGAAALRHTAAQAVAADPQRAQKRACLQVRERLVATYRT